MGLSISKDGERGDTGVRKVRPMSRRVLADLRQATSFSYSEIRLLKTFYESAFHRYISPAKPFVSKDVFIRYFSSSGFIGERLFFIVDANQDGAMDLSDFVRFLHILGPRSPVEEKINFLFKFCDIDTKGHLTDVVLTHITSSLLHHMCGSNPPRPYPIPSSNSAEDPTASTTLIDTPPPTLDKAAEGIGIPREAVESIVRGLFDRRMRMGMGRLGEMSLGGFWKGIRGLMKMVLIKDGLFGEDIRVSKKGLIMTRCINCWE
ncbi:hypothetical protein BC829DRAFT_391818 [Chytridium lagenaria]|nr:hypothetical protein BC829DRAFT_391818 [Chytridium lagenaria]